MLHDVDVSTMFDSLNYIEMLYFDWEKIAFSHFDKNVTIKYVTRLI